MEGLKNRLYVVGGILFAFGVTMAALPKPKYDPKTEKWLEQNAPQTVAGFAYQQSSDNPQQSYRMDQLTYDTLTPYGIVARVFSKGSEAYDTVLIAGANGKTFHNPKVCFTGSGFQVQDGHTVLVPTRTQGMVPMSVARLNGKPGEESITAFCYRTPLGFRASTVEIRRDLILSKLLQKPDLHGVFYRFIPRSGVVNEKDLLKFAGEFIDAAHESSKGYF